jgi:NAD(P)-dependent dehydrogenase (short-subunit alcohol dehydrogenase family)
MKIHSGKKVVVTGAAGALGQVVAQKFFQAGFEVTGTSHESSVPSFDGAQSMKWIQVDLTNSQSMKKAFSQQKFDIAVHCAGGFRFAFIDQLSDSDLDFLVNTNLKSAFYLIRELLPHMKDQNFGRIVFVSAKATFQPGAGMGAYAATKAGLNMLTAALAEEVKKFDITVNAVLPSVIDTPPNRRDMPKANFYDWVTPAQLAEIIFSLTASLGKPIHGALIPVAGRV